VETFHIAKIKTQNKNQNRTMAGFGANDAFFGLDGLADAPPAAKSDGFDLDRDDINKQFDMSSLGEKKKNKSE
jgi:hypothetical protein